MDDPVNIALKAGANETILLKNLTPTAFSGQAGML
jgi:hypothetical protein